MKFHVVLVVSAGSFNLRRDEVVEAKDLLQAMDTLVDGLPDPKLDDADSISLHIDVKPA